MKRKYKLVNISKNKIIAICISFVVVFSIAYICGQLFCEWDKFNETVATLLTLIGAVTFLIEFSNNEKLNEAQFIMELNNQFISSETMSDVEWDLEKFYNKYYNNELTEEYINDFKKKYDIEKPDRQKLVNYLVHLEGIAALVKNKVLHIETIDDLMSYRYFIALNNPVVQELELIQFADFYKGCFSIYEDWVKELNNREIPMIKHYRLPKMEEVKQHLQKTD